MIRVFIFTLTWFAFGVIAAEIFNSFEILGERLNVLVVAVPAALFFMTSQGVLTYLKNNADDSPADEARYKMILKHYHLILGLLGFIAFIIIPFVWWGVIEKLAGLASEGVRNF